MSRGFFLIAAVLSAATPTSAATRVRVIDPHGGAIVAARVEIHCLQTAGGPRVHVTDAEGTFVPPDDAGCELIVDASGFTPWRGALDEARRRGTVQLALAPVTLRVVVDAAATPMPWSPLTSALVTRDDLRIMAWDAGLALRYARARAGTTLREDRVYVDGLPAAAIPPASTIDTISINADPFSVLYSESDQNVIDVVSVAPDRRFWWNGGLVPRKVGGHNPLAPEMSATRTVQEISVGGPVPRTPMTFSIDLSKSSVVEERPLFSLSEPDPETARSSGQARTVAIGLVGQWRPGLRTRASMVSFRARDDGGSVGGFVRPEAGTVSDLRSDEVRVVLEASGDRYRYRTGLIYTATGNVTRAASDQIGLVILDAFVGGGAPVEMMQLKRRDWLWNNTLARADSSWLAGWLVASERTSDRSDPNPFGQLIFGSVEEHAAAMQGHGGGTWSRIAGAMQQNLQSITGAVYGQKEWRASPAAAVRAGARVDYQSGDGVAVSPRLSAHTVVRGLRLQSGIGLFRQNWSNEILMYAQRFDAGGAQWLVSDAPADGPSERVLGERVQTVVDGALRRPLSVVARNGLEVRHRRARIGLEHAWTSAIRRPASRRDRTAEGWVDRLESSRRLRRHQLHGRAELPIAGASVVAHYEWVVSNDDGNGAFSFLEFPDDPRREWARSAGVAPHHVSVVANLPSAHGITAGAMWTSRSRAPLDVRTGVDPAATRLYLDRGGRSRNSGRGPAYTSLDGFAFRRFPIPLIKVRPQRLFLDATVSAENLLGAVNYETLGAVLASPFYGQPVAAQPGRTLRLSLRISR